jgi:hypothetical protein
MLPTDVRDFYTCVGPLEDGRDVATGETKLTQVEYPMIARIQSFTYHLDHFSGGLRNNHILAVMSFQWRVMANAAVPMVVVPPLHEADPLPGGCHARRALT